MMKMSKLVWGPVVWASLGLALGGCNLAPHYDKPATDVPATFKENVVAAGSASAGPAPAGADWRPAAPNDEHLGGKWWERFGDPDLNALEERVSVSNQTIALAEANFRQARALVGEARAALFPTVAVAPSVVRSRSSAAGGNTAGASSSGSASSGQPGQTHNQYTLPIDASYEIDLWGAIRNGVAQNRYAAEASAADVAAAILSTQADLATDYFELRATDEQRHIFDTTLADYRASLHLVYVLQKSGMASDEDVAEAVTALDAAEAQSTDLGIARAQFEHAIAVLLGVPPARFALPAVRFHPRLPAIPVAVPSEILERRPDIAAAERRVAAANAGIGIARAAYFPELSLSGAFGYQANHSAQWFDWPNRFWSVGPTLAETLFEGGLRRAQNAAARAAYDEAVAAYRQTALSAFQAVEDDLVGLRLLSKEVVQQHAAAESARHTVELSVARYKAGIDSYVNVITAQNAFLTNRLAELQVQLRQVSTTVALINNLGGGWDATQTGATERAAEKPPQPDGRAPGETVEAEPNPPAAAGAAPDPEELLQQNREDMSPSGSASK